MTKHSQKRPKQTARQKAKRNEEILSMYIERDENGKYRWTIRQISEKYRMSKSQMHRIIKENAEIEGTEFAMRGKGNQFKPWGAGPYKRPRKKA